MIKGKKLLAVVPARGGSKGVKLKNIHPLQGIPLVAHVASIVREAGFFDRAIVSTDHPQIADVAQQYGLDVPFYRPEQLSGDRIGDLDVLRHALQEAERIDKTRYDLVVMLQPTSPLRRAEHVAATVNKLIDEGWDAVWTVSTTDLKYHPLKQLKFDESGAMDYYTAEGAKIIARQQLEPVYHRNGAVYCFTRECLLDQRTIKGRRTSAVVIDEPMVSIDTLADFEVVERILHERKQQDA